MEDCAQELRTLGQGPRRPGQAPPTTRFHSQQSTGRPRSPAGSTCSDAAGTSSSGFSTAAREPALPATDGSVAAGSTSEVEAKLEPRLTRQRPGRPAWCGRLLVVPSAETKG